MEQQLPPLHLACGNDELRPNICLIEIKGTIATATDGHMIVKIDLSQNGNLTPDQIKVLDGRFIHSEVWKELHKCDLIELDETGMWCNKNGIRKGFEYSEVQGTFFKIDTIIEAAKIDGEESKRLVSYNPAFITVLAKIFQSSTMHFSFTKGKNKGTIIFPSEHCGMFALLMPVDSDGVNRYLFL